jgi:hypothetical protein
MFIKTIFALYFTAIAIAAPQPPLNSIGSDAGKVVNSTSSSTWVQDALNTA